MNERVLLHIIIIVLVNPVTGCWKQHHFPVPFPFTENIFVIS